MYGEESLSVCLLWEIRIIAQLNWKGTQAQHLHFINGETEAQKGGMIYPKVNRDARPQLKQEYRSAHSQVQLFLFPTLLLVSPSARDLQARSWGFVPSPPWVTQLFCQKVCKRPPWNLQDCSLVWATWRVSFSIILLDVRFYLSL